MMRRVFIFFGYLCVALLVIGFTVVLVAYGRDYSYDFTTHSIIQKGHVIIQSVPGGTIKEDGRLLKKNTPYQAAYMVGEHTFGVVKDGFWPWQKVLRVTAGRVVSATYVLLIPKKPAQTILDTRSAVVTTALSHDRRHLAYITAGPDAAVFALELGNHKVTRLYGPKAATPTEGAETLHEVTWSDDGSHVVIGSDVGGVPVHRLLAVGAVGESVNLTQAYGFNLTGIKFSGWNWHQLFWISPDGLRKLDVEAQTVSGVLADKVTQFWVEPDRVLYVQQTELGRSLWSIDSRGKRQEIVQALAESDTYGVALSRFDGQDLLAVVPAKTGIATLYSDIYGDTQESKVIAKGVTGVSFSPNGQFLALTGGQVLRVHDLLRSELEQRFVLYDAPTFVHATLTWFDNFHFLANRGGQVTLSEFDGDNSVTLGEAYGAFGGFATADAHSVVQLRPSGTGVAIVQLEIR